MSSNPILVTGTHRSGTTWIGQMLSLPEDVLYIHEPFNVQLQKERGRKPPFARWYQQVEGMSSAEQEMIRNYLAGFQRYTANNIVNNSYKRNAAASWKWVKTGRSSTRYLYKDPLALLSAVWVHEQLAASVVVMIRHPAAFAASLKVKNWNFPFSDLAEQPSVITQLPMSWQDEIRKFAVHRPGIVKQATLLWNVLHYFIQKYRETFPEWQYIRHEDISADPLPVFKKLYAALGLKYSEKIEIQIIGSSSGGEAADSTKTNILRRDSVSNIKSWKKRLTEEEIDLVRKNTAEIAQHFYSETDW